MFVQDGIRNSFPRPRRRRGWGRIAALAVLLVVVSARVAYGSGPVVMDTVVVGQGDTVWNIAASHYAGDPRPHVEAILIANHLSSPVVQPGQTLRLPRD